MINGKAFLNVCDYLLSNAGCTDEEFYRTVIGRAYYGSYLHGRDKLISERKITIRQIKGRDSHKKVVDKLRKEDSFIAQQLQQLKRERQKADYHLDKTIKQKDALNSFKLAKLLVLRIDAI
jgi:uncharacterized protein (UPF0332 family)